MKLATYNINGINKRIRNLLEWLSVSKPDIVCLQELKAPQASFPEEVLRHVGYQSVWIGEASWNGVAILSRGSSPVLTRSSLPGDATDRAARYIEAAVNGVLVGCLYTPNGNPRPGPKFDYKLRWLDRLAKHADELIRSGLPVVLAGDFNVVPEATDIYVTTSYDNNALVQPAPRAAFRSLIDQGWTDVLRPADAALPVYTFWDYRRHRWERNAGLRIDHILASPPITSRIRSAGVDRDTRGRDGASDHAPAWVVLGEH